MNILAVISIFLFFWRVSDCASMKFHQDEREENESIKENSAALGASAADNATDRNDGDQADPKSSDVITEDRHEPLNSLVESLDGPLEQSIKEKRCKNDRLVGSSRSAPNLPLTRRDTAAGLLRRSCENCMNSAICKMKGKCESCKKICDKYEASLDMKENQMDEPTREQNPDQIVGLSSRMSESDGRNGGLSFEDTKYYTVGSFGPGPVHNLLAKLLNIKDTDHFEQLLILAKIKSKMPPKFEHPVIIDTAHIFTLNNGGPSKLNTEIHEVADSDAKVDDVAFEVDRQIEKAMENKRKMTGSSHLTPGEIDEIIQKVLTEKSRSGFNQNARNVELSDRNKNKSIIDKVQDDGEETIYLPYRPNNRDNEENLPNDGEVFVDNRFQQSEMQEQVPGGETLTEHPSSSNEGLPIARSDFAAHRLAQKAPFHPDSEIMSTETLPTAIFSRPRPPGPVIRQQSREKNIAESESLEPGQEPLHGSQTIEDRPQRPPLIPFKGKQEGESHISEHMNQPPFDRMEHFTKHSRPPHGPPRDRINQGEAEEAAQLREAFVTPKTLELYSASKSLQSADVYAPDYANHQSVADKDHVVGKKLDFIDENEEKLKKLPMENENSPNLEQKAPFHPDSEIRTTEPTPTTVYSRIKAPVRTNEKKIKGTSDSEAFDATSNLPHRAPTLPSNAKPLKESAQTEETSELLQSSGLYPASNAFHTTDDRLKAHASQIYAPNYPIHQRVSPDSFGNENHLNGKEGDFTNAEGDQTQGKNVENGDFHKDNLKEWTNENVASENSPILEQKAPFHPDSEIRTTEPTPTTVYSRIKAPVRTNEKKTKDTGDSEAFDATSNLPHRAPTLPSNAKPLNESPQTEETSQFRHASDAFQTADDRLKEHTDHIYAPNYQTHEKPYPYSRTSQELNPMDDSTNIVGKIEDSTHPDDNKLGAEGLENAPEESTNLGDTYEEKYNKLKQWVRDNMKLDPSIPENVHDIIDSAAKINEKISDMVHTKAKDPNLLQMVKENDEKLKALDEDQKNEFVVKLPDMREFKTKLPPGSKLNKISNRPSTSKYASKSPYESHPRRISKYENGKWTYEKTKPNRPPYTTKHRVAEILEKQARNGGGFKPKIKRPEQEPVFIDAKLLDLEDVMEDGGGYVETPMVPFDQVKVVDMSKMKNAENHPPQSLKPDLSPRTGQEEQPLDEQENREGHDKMIDETKEMVSDQQIEQNGETVACSKEEEEEIYQLMHLHPPNYGGYRSSQPEDSKHHLPSIKHLLTPNSRSSEHRSDDKGGDRGRYTTESTEEMINSLNKMHKHGKTTSDEARNGEGFAPNQKEFAKSFDEGMEDDGQYFPQEVPRFAPQSYEEAMRMNPELSRDEMNPDFFKPELIGSPAIENRLQDYVPEDLTRLGKLLPRNGERMLSLHHRDVSEQDKLKNMYFVGDGIKLPLNMKEHDDGSLHLTVDVNSLCNCKHCTEKRLENGTIILEVPASDLEGDGSTNEPQALEEATENPTENFNKDSDQSSESNSLSSEEMKNLENQEEQLPEHSEDPKGDISKRSPKTNSLQDDETDLSQEELVIPVRKLSRQQILSRLAEVEENEKELEEEKEKINDHNDSGVSKKIKLFTNVLDFMKKVALDVQSKK